MMSIRSLADFNRSSLGGDSDWLIPPPSTPRPQAPGRHGERGVGTFNWPPARTSTWPHAGTFSWPWTDSQWTTVNLTHTAPADSASLVSTSDGVNSTFVILGFACDAGGPGSCGAVVGSGCHPPAGWE